jgi:DNA-binding transcriptional ArsR family regulator
LSEGFEEFPDGGHLLRSHPFICTFMQMTGVRDVQLEALDSIEACDVRVVDPAKVAQTRERLPSPAATDRLADWFKVLGDATRARILYAVLEAGELCVCDLAATVDVPESTVSHALRWLRGAGVVRARRSGKMMYYRLDDEHVRMLLDIGREHLRHREGGC